MGTQVGARLLRFCHLRSRGLHATGDGYEHSDFALVWGLLFLAAGASGFIPGLWHPAPLIILNWLWMRSMATRCACSR